MNKTRVKNKILAKNPLRVGMELKKKHRNKVGMKTQKETNMIQKDGGEEMQEGYPTRTSVLHT